MSDDSVSRRDFVRTSAVALPAAVGLAGAAHAAPAVQPLGAFTRNVRVLFQGDSITDGNRGRSADPNHILGHGYCFIIAARHGAAFPETNLEFYNRGVSGNTVLDLQQRWQKDTLDLAPNLLSILIGVNDEGRGVAPEQYQQVYDKLLEDTLQFNPKLRLVLCEPFTLPVGGMQAAGPDGPPGIRRRQEIVAGLAAKYKAALVPCQQALHAACQRGPAEHWIWDGVHPTYSGHQILADAWEEAVRKFWP